MSIDQIVMSHKFFLEHHQVETSDGYILTLHRIPCNITQKFTYFNTNQHEYESTQKGVILLMHGCPDSSMQWIINAEN